MKRVTFNGKPPSTLGLNADSWVENREIEFVPKEPTKRFTIDVPISLHKRIKSSCALENLVMADVIRDILHEKFPATVGPGGTT